MSHTTGTKVTTDPSTFNDPKNENPGMVTSDSLAAESIQSGGQFGANSDSRGPSAQPSYSTTSNTTDTSNATVLDPARDRRTRSDEEGYTGPTGDRSTGAPTSSSIPVSQPKGSNLTEGHFDGSAPNASFNTDIGGRKDPGRVALETFQEKDVPSSGGAGPRQTELTRDGQFDGLRRDEEA